MPDFSSLVRTNEMSSSATTGLINLRGRALEVQQDPAVLKAWSKGVASKGPPYPTAVSDGMPSRTLSQALAHVSPADYEALAVRPGGVSHCLTRLGGRRRRASGPSNRNSIQALLQRGSGERWSQGGPVPVGERIVLPALL